MTKDAGDLSNALVAARIQSSPLPQPESDIGLDSAYAIQRKVHAASGLPVMVWKLGLTTEGARSAFGATEPAVGRLPASAIYCNGSEIRFSAPETYAEAELIFELIDDLPPQPHPYTRETVIPAIGALYAGIEICSTRFAQSDLPLGWLIADNVMAHGLVLGKKLAQGWDDRFSNCPVSLVRNEEEPVAGSTVRVMDDPLNAVVWLANWLCKNGEGGLRREQLVAAGSCTGITEIHAGDRVSIAFNDTKSAQIILLAE